MATQADRQAAFKKVLHFTPQATEFINGQSGAVQKAMFEKLDKLARNGFLSEPDAKVIAPNLFEVRVKVSPLQYRLFYCYIGENGVWVLSGFVKKVQKTPRQEKRKAIRIRKEVEHEKGR